MKRVVGALLVAVLLVIFVACGVPTSTRDAVPSPSPTVAATSRDVHSEPVQVDETYANADVTQPSAAPSATAAPTPATGDTPLFWVGGVVGLIVFCAAGLLRRKRSCPPALSRALRKTQPFVPADSAGVKGFCCPGFTDLFLRGIPCRKKAAMPI